MFEMKQDVEVKIDGIWVPGFIVKVSLHDTLREYNIYFSSGNELRWYDKSVIRIKVTRQWWYKDLFCRWTLSKSTNWILNLESETFRVWAKDAKEAEEIKNKMIQYLENIHV